MCASLFFFFKFASFINIVCIKPILEMFTPKLSHLESEHMFTSQCIELMYIAFSILGLSGIVAPPFAGSNPFGITGGTTGQSYGGNIISPTK